jgi:hypothetical protein
MTKEKKFLRFEKGNMPDEIEVHNIKKEFLGIIEYDRKWHKWVFVPEAQTYYSSSCLEEIVTHIKELNKNAA